MPRFMCATCGSQFADSAEPPPACPVCEDPRQYVPAGGQRWTTLDELRAEHHNEVRAEHELVGIGTSPHFAIGQRALLVPHGDGNVLWDCVSLLDDATAAAVEERGGLSAVAISHPHYYSSMVEWAHRFDCPVLLHAADREWIMRPDPAIELWEGERRDLGHGLTLVRGGGHFPGAAMLHRAEGAGSLLSGDVIQVIPDRTHVSFMWSYPNLVPLDEATMRGVAGSVEDLPFDSLYGAWWGTVIPQDASAIVARSADRYARALRGEL